MTRSRPRFFNLANIVLLLALLSLSVLSGIHSHGPQNESRHSCTLCMAHQDLANGVPITAIQSVCLDDSPKTVFIREIRLPLDSTILIQPARAPPSFLV